MNHEGYRDPTAEAVMERLWGWHPIWIKDRLWYRIGELAAFRYAVEVICGLTLAHN